MLWGCCGDVVGMSWVLFVSCGDVLGFVGRLWGCRGLCGEVVGMLWGGLLLNFCVVVFKGV